MPGASLFVLCQDTLVVLPMGDGERWMKSDQSQVKEI
jgi:hypothetical protein